MASSSGNGERPSGGTASQAVFRQGPEHLLLSNAAFDIAFSIPAQGTIIAVNHHRSGIALIHGVEAASEGDLWRIELVSRTGSQVTLTNRTCERFEHRVETDPQGAIHLTLTWSELCVGAAHVAGHVSAHFAFPGDGALLFAELDFVLPEGLSVGRVDFPRVCSLGSSDTTMEEGVFLPLGDGVLVPEPEALFSLSHDRVWQVEYPGPASMQLIGYTCGSRTAFWLSTRDTEGAHKTMSISGMLHSHRLALWFSHYPAAPDKDGRWSVGYQTILGLAAGDWYEAAKAYRRWALRQPWCARGMLREHDPPALTVYQGMWLTYWGGGARAAESARELLRHVNAPIRLDWREWHGEPYPDCFPPRDGEQSLAASLEALSQARVYAQLALPGQRASTHARAWQEARLDTAAAGEAVNGMAPMCGNTDAWPYLLAELAAQGTKRGAEGIYLASLATAVPTACSRETHGHPPGASLWTQGVRSVMYAIRRAIGESYHLAADGPVESYLDLLDAFISYHTVAERLESFGDQFGGRWSPIPIFTSVYHEYCTHLALGPTLTGLTPRSVPDITRQAEYVLGRDLSAQFCVEIARGLVWGRQLALSHFLPEQGREEVNRRKLAFVSAALRAQTWGVGAVIPESEFLGPLTIATSPVEADFVLMDSKGRPRITKRRLCPVLGTAWRIPGGGNVLLLANIHEHQVDFSIPLNDSRIVLNLPLHLVGRMFSEDGDALAATLRGVGTEVQGRMPARSLLLVTLY